jgi:DNA-directed RNA polymerase subunit RPC12/RpoP
MPEFVVLKSFTNYIEAHIILGRMKDEGLDCWLKNENTTTIMPIWTTALGGIQLMVNKAQAQKAAYVLKVIDNERKEQTSCPRCNSRDVEYINTMRKPVNWLSAAVSFFLGDYAVMPEQRYHCFACGNEWEEKEATE